MLETQHKDALNENKSLAVMCTELQNSDAILKTNLAQKEKELTSSHERYVYTNSCKVCKHMLYSMYVHPLWFFLQNFNVIWETYSVQKLQHFK